MRDEIFMGSQILNPGVFIPDFLKTPIGFFSMGLGFFFVEWEIPQKKHVFYDLLLRTWVNCGLIVLESWVFPKME